MPDKEDVIRIDGDLYVKASSSHVDSTIRVLKHGDSFAVVNRRGDITKVVRSELGLYHDGMRHLSHWEIYVGGERPLLLSSSLSHDTTVLQVDLTNDNLVLGDQFLPRDTVHIQRSILLRDACWYETLTFTHYGQDSVTLPLTLELDADFADLFEVRGTSYANKPQPRPPCTTDDGVETSYLGGDGIMRRTHIKTKNQPNRFRAGLITLSIELQPGASAASRFTIACVTGKQTIALTDYDAALEASRRDTDTLRSADACIFTSNEQFNDWVNRSQADLHMLITNTVSGPYPYAGIPWFSTPFGRDGIITALEYLWVNPDLAKGVLTYLASTQAEEINPEREAEPGKILHETRRGELAAIGIIPFDRYYGTVDATPLFVMLAGAYFRRTGDHVFLGEIWPQLRRALSWIDDHGDLDGDGFVEYIRHTTTGLANQGWKDSDDAIVHENGSLARGPIALCEVQGYVYAAKRAGAELAELFEDTERAQALRRQAAELKKRFHECFWLHELGTYALALDGDKQPCRVMSSNAGHTLLTGICDDAQAKSLADTLLAEKSFCGWGIRTLAEGEARYNPMSYHNGSIWPHDSALIAMGLARYNFKDHAQRILTGLFETSLRMDANRLPELFCGFAMRPGEHPILYPVACAPQAWSSAAVFYLIQACLGLSFHLSLPQVRFSHPQLPEYLDWIEVRNLRVNNGTVDLVLHRHTRNVGLNVLRKTGNVEVAVLA